MTICEHIKDNGSTCGSPALTGYTYCFFHQRLRHPRHRPGDFEYKLPILDTPHSIHMAIQHITQAALDGVLEEGRARLVLSALRLAHATLKEMNNEDGVKKDDQQKRLDAARPRAAFETAEVQTGNFDLDTAACPEQSRRALARVTRAQLAVPADTTTRRNSLETDAPTLSSRAPVNGGEGPAFASANTHSASAATAAPEGSPRREPWVSITSTSKAPAGATDTTTKKPPQSAPLSATQLKLMKKILRRGPSHPRFHTAARLIDHHIAGGD